MNDKLQQELIALQDKMKDAIMNEPDLEKQASIIAKFSKQEQELSEKIQKDIEKVWVIDANTRTSISNMKEKELVALANSLWIIASIKDNKEETRDKLLLHLWL